MVGMTYLWTSQSLIVKRLFLVEGVLTVGFAVIFAAYLPNSPNKIVGLNKLEHEWLRWNYESDQKQRDDSGEISAKQGFIMAVCDPKTWLLMGTLYAVRLILA